MHAFRLCHENTSAFFDEMRRYDKTWRSQVLLTEALAGAHIAESRKSRLNTLCQELMNEFLNVRLLQVMA